MLVYDNRNFGDRDGEPRQEVDPFAQIRDYRNAITYGSSLPEVDADRIGRWGTSYTGGHALVVAAIDKRVKCGGRRWPLTYSASATGGARAGNTWPAPKQVSR